MVCPISGVMYVFCTVPNIAVFLQPLEDLICCTLLPTVLGIYLHPIMLFVTQMLYPRPLLDGLGVFNPTVQCVLEYFASMDITGQLSNYIVSGQSINYFMVMSSEVPDLVMAKGGKITLGAGQSMVHWEGSTTSTVRRSSPQKPAIKESYSIMKGRLMQGKAIL